MSPKDVHVGKTKTIVGGHNVITVLSVSTLHLLVGVFHSLVALSSLVRSFTACLSFQWLLFVFQAFWFQIRPPHLFVKKLQSHFRFCILHFTNLTPTHFPQFAPVCSGSWWMRGVFQPLNFRPLHRAEHCDMRSRVWACGGFTLWWSYSDGDNLPQWDLISTVITENIVGQLN